MNILCLHFNRVFAACLSGLRMVPRSPALLQPYSAWQQSSYASLCLPLPPSATEADSGVHRHCSIKQSSQKWHSSQIHWPRVLRRCAKRLEHFAIQHHCVWDTWHLQASSQNTSFCHVIPLIFPNCTHQILFCIFTLKSVLEVIFNDTVIILVS